MARPRKSTKLRKARTKKQNPRHKRKQSRRRGGGPSNSEPSQDISVRKDNRNPPGHGSITPGETSNEGIRAYWEETKGRGSSKPKPVALGTSGQFGSV